jgi:2',3'-cyclic-nucleotide 2'-phosphodiesterase/3'-nucleotidase/5'-nucleotidase
LRRLKTNLMKNHLTPLLLLLIITLQAGYLFSQSVVDLKLIGRYSSNVYDGGGTEIAAYDAATSHLFSVNAATGALDIIDLSDPSNPVLVSSIYLSPYGAAANSVAIMNGIVAAAVEDTNKQENGSAVFFDAAGNYLNQVEVGALPDMLTFTPDGMKVLVANEGEPSSDYTVDPVGSVSIIDLSGGIAGLSQANVTTLDFSAYNNTILDPSIRVYGPNATVAQDMEPEYIAVSGNSEKAYVTLQENNALGVINLKNNKIVSLIGLGFKDYMDVNNKLDASDQNSAIVNITNWPVYGMYQPDAIKHVRLKWQ